MVTMFEIFTSIPNKLEVFLSENSPNIGFEI